MQVGNTVLSQFMSLAKDVEGILQFMFFNSICRNLAAWYNSDIDAVFVALRSPMVPSSCSSSPREFAHRPSEFVLLGCLTRISCRILLLVQVARKKVCC